MSLTFESETLFINSRSDMKDKIDAIDAIIAALLVRAADSVGTEDVSEYSLDDGQTKIKTVFRGMSAILKAIQDFETLRQMYFNRLNGHVVQLRDSKSVLSRLGIHHL